MLKNTAYFLALSLPSTLPDGLSCSIGGGAASEAAGASSSSAVGTSGDLEIGSEFGIGAEAGAADDVGWGFDLPIQPLKKLLFFFLPEFVLLPPESFIGLAVFPVPNESPADIEAFNSRAF